MKILGIQPGLWPEVSLAFETDEWNKLTETVERGRTVKSASLGYSEGSDAELIRQTDSDAHGATLKGEQADDGLRKVSWDISSVQAVGNMLLYGTMHDATINDTPYLELAALGMQLKITQDEALTKANARIQVGSE